MKKLNLKAFRAAHDLSQQGMADRLGIARSTYSMIERGERSASASTIVNFAREFCISPGQAFELMEGKTWRESGKETAQHD